MTDLAPPSATDAGAVEILFFGAIADSFGRRRRLPIPHAGIGLDDLRRRLAAETDDRILAPGLRIAIDQVLVRGEATVRPGQEIAVMSPFSGG